MIDGIDVAYPQGLVDWKAVAASNQVSFAAAKATQGLNIVDSQFHNNWNGIKDAGLIRGTYHYGLTQNDPVKEANFFLDMVGQLTPFDFLALDIEQSTLSGAVFVKWVLTWLQTVENRSGKIPFVYTGGPFFNQYAGKVDPTVTATLQKYPLWLAGYVTNPDNFVPTIWKGSGWLIWQKSGDVAAPGGSLYHVPGIKCVVDHNVFRGSSNDLTTLILNLHSGQDNALASAIASIVAQP
jgi:lysozyme